MNDLPLTVIDLDGLSEKVGAAGYLNSPLSFINDHVIRMSVMTESYYWHYHPNSDETFLVIEGSIFIDLETGTVELFPNQLFTIPKNVPHRTRPNGSRSVNLTFELKEMKTVSVQL
jgi:hypothetical protein